MYNVHTTYTHKIYVLEEQLGLIRQCARVPTFGTEFDLILTEQECKNLQMPCKYLYKVLWHFNAWSCYAMSLFVILQSRSRRSVLLELTTS